MGQEHNKPRQIKPDPRMVARSRADQRAGRSITTKQYLAEIRKK